MKNFRLNKINPILLMELNVETYNSWDNEEQKEVFLRSLFQFFKMNDYSKEHIVFMTRELGMTKEMYVKLMNEYFLRLPVEARPKIEIVDEKFKIIVREKTALEEAYDKLTTPMNETQLTLFFRKYEKYKFFILRDYSRFKLLYHEKEYQNIVDNINLYKKHKDEINKVTFKETARLGGIPRMHDKKKDISEVGNTSHVVYKGVSSSQKRNEPVVTVEQLKKEREEKVEKARKVIQLIIDNNTYHIMHLLKENGIGKNEFKKIVNLIKTEDEALYKKYSGKRTRIINAVTKEMENAKNENRKFDVIDYQIITDMEPGELVEYTRGMKAILLRKFSTANFLAFRDEENFDSKAFSEEVIFFAKFDSSDRYIEGSGYVLTKEDKQSFLNFLDYCKMFKNQYTYMALRNRFRKGIEITSPDKKVHIKALNRTNE